MGDVLVRCRLGTPHECDLLIAVPGGLYLLELKGHPGRVENRGDTWSVHEPGRRWPRTLRNPLSLTDLKAKELKTRFEWAAKKRSYTGPLPRIEAATFLSAGGLVSELDEVQAMHVYGRDEASQGLPWVWRDLLSRPPRREHRRITPAFSRDVLPGLLREIGIRAATAHLRFGDDWTLDTEKLDAGETWEDRLARRKAIVDETGRVRIYLTSQQAGEERRAQVERAARREYQVLQGITHRGSLERTHVEHRRAAGACRAPRRGPAGRAERPGPEGPRVTALPRRLAGATLAARLADSAGATRVLREPTSWGC